MSEQEFVKEVTDGLLPPPAYFLLNVAMNKNGYDSIDAVMERGSRALNVEEFETAANETDALVLDTRNADVFRMGFVPNSINIGLDGQFAPWVGALIPDVKQQILLITDPGKEEETVIRLARVGYDYVIGYLAGGFDAWRNSGKEIDTVTRITADEFALRVDIQKDIIIDVRRASEYEAEHVENANNIPLDFINENIASFPKDEHFFLHCAGGYRSMITSSILKSRGWDNFTEVAGGFNAIAKTEVPKTSFVCQSKK
jgi:rhodanese-related sulfurtransferase